MAKNRRLVTLGSIAAAVWLVALALLIAPPDASNAPVPTLAKLNALPQLSRPLLQPIALSGRSITQTPSFLPDSSLPAEPSINVTAPREPVPNEVILHFDPETPAEERANYIAGIGGTISKDIPALNTAVVMLSNPTIPLPPSPVVLANEPDYYVSALSDASDPLYAQQWGLSVVGAPAAWDSLPANPAPITVAVIDSGICADHPDLSGRIAVGWDFVQNDSTPQDEFGHGCAVAGIIAANSNNSVGIAGVAPNTQIMPVRVLDGSGIGRYSDVAAAVVYATDHGAKIINLSLGGYSTSSVMQSAVNYAVSRGVLVIAAAGNTGTQTVLYPAAYPAVIAVGAVNQNLQAASFSSYGPNVDVWAPGQGIMTTSRDGNYAALNGTSFAAPHVAGVAALEMANGRSLAVNGGIARAGTTTVVSAPTETPDASTAAPTLTLPANALPALFLDTDTQGAQSYVSALGVLRTRYVEVNFGALPADSSPQAQAASSPRIALNLFDDVQLTAVSDEITPRLLESDGLIWTGSIEGLDYGEVVLVVGNHQVEGHVSILGRTYQITYAGNGVHSINEIDPIAYKLNLHDDGVPVPTSQTAQTQPVAQQVTANVDNGSVIDVMVVYTPAVFTASSGNIGSMIQAAVVATNKSYANSGVIQRLRLRHTAQVTYTETSADDSLNQPLVRVSTIPDGYIDNVDTLRNQYKADLVVFIVKTNVSNVCGLAWMPGLSNMTPNDLGNWGYSTVAYDCLPGGITFAHELGHNMGSNHDIAHASGNPAYSYSYGYQDPSGAFADVMAYQDGCPLPCPAINYWSNQTMLFGGRAMGSSTADNVTSLNNTAAKIAIYRYSEVGGGNPTPQPTLTLTVQPTSLPVATSTPPATPSGSCTFNASNDAQLISAINSANSNGAGNDTICLTANITLTTTNINYYGNNGLPVITTSITIKGFGHTIARSSGQEFRHFLVDASEVDRFGNLTLDSVTLSNGNASSDFDAGGSILNLIGTLSISNSTLTSNQSSEGGAIFNYGAVTTLNHVTLSNNRASFGGAIENYSGSLNILNSTLYANVAQDGGGIWVFGEVGFPSTTTISGSNLTENSGWQETYDTFGNVHGSSVIFSQAPAGSTTTISNSCIFNNANFALYVETGTPGISAEQNWWGSPHGPTVNGKIAGDMVSVGVDFDPFRSVEAGPCTEGPPNNMFADRFIIGTLPYMDTQNTTFAGVEPLEQTPSCVASFGRSVWYSYTPASNETVWLRTNASDFDTVVSVWTGNTLGSLTQVGCDNDSGPGNRSSLVVSLTGGQTYQIMAAGNAGAVGNMVLYVSNRPSGDILVVNSNNDASTTCDATNCSLREAITLANGTAGTQTILFDIQDVTGTGPFTIAVTGASLPAITDTVIIDATTQYGYMGQPIVELNGENAGTNPIGLRINTTNSTVRGFVINCFLNGLGNCLSSGVGVGIQINGNTNVLEHNYIGTDVTGGIARPNNIGIEINSSNNTVGGLTPGNGNLISGNSNSLNNARGIVVNGSGNVIQGNLIGTNAAGSAAIPNNLGILITSANNDIGGTVSGARNIISGNTQHGIELNGASATGNDILGNFIGTNISGIVALANLKSGIFVTSANGNTIGGSTGTTPGGSCSGACNVIAGNGENGITINGSTTGNDILGNFIGTDVNGMAALANAGSGILVSGNNNSIGGTTSAERNIISANANHGIFIGSSSGNVIQGNFIGTDTTGTLDLGNAFRGIEVGGVASNNVIGPSNVISGNNVLGIGIGGSATLNVVRGNYIGTNWSGTAALPNSGSGILIADTANQNTIGGTTPADRNIISGNTGSGVQITGGGVTPNLVQGNYIGTNTAGTSGIPNGSHGMLIDTVLNNNINNTVGGTTAGAGNVIAFNLGDGVYVSADNGNTISGNNLHSNGGLGIDLGTNGVTLNGSGGPGANNLQNFPVFTGGGSYSGSTTVSGTLMPNSTFDIEIFSNTSCDTSGHGEGQVYRGFADNVSTDTNGNFSVTIAGDIPPNEFITMTATDLSGNTSEFSKCPLAAPTSLNAAAFSQVRIDLTWTDNTPGETNVRVERSPDGTTNWTEIAVLSANSTSYQSSSLVCDEDYFYRVRTSTASDYSGYSNVANATTLACALHNMLANAVVIGGLPYTDPTPQSNLGASTESGETTASCALNATSTLWYRYTPGADQTVWFDTTTANFDTVISVWTGTAFPLNPVGCDNNSGPNGTSFLPLSLTGGTTYYIAVAGVQGAGGTFTLRVQIPPALTPVPTPTEVPPPTIAPDDATSRIGVFKNGTWLLSNSFSGGAPDLAFKFGPQESGWLPIVGDWDGDSQQVDTIGLYRDGRFWQRDLNAAGFADNYFTFGPQESGWLPIVGDWDGDGKDSIGLFKNGHFGLRNSNSSGQADYNFTFGLQEADWLPVAGDWDGDGIDTIGVYKNGHWRLRNSNSKGEADLAFNYGPTEAGWQPVVGDWDKDGTDTVGLYRSGVWWLRDSNNPGSPDILLKFGPTEAGWSPVAGCWDGTLALGVLLSVDMPTEAPTSLPTATLAPSQTPIILEATATASETATLEPPTFTPTETPTLEPSLTPSPTLTPTEAPSPETTDSPGSP